MEIIKFLSYSICELLLIDHTIQLIGLSTLLAAILCYVLRGRKPKFVPLTWEEEEEIIRKFEPEDLVPEGAVPPKRRIVQSVAGKFVTVDGQRCLNLASHNYLGYVEDDEVIRKAADSISQQSPEQSKSCVVTAGLDGMAIYPKLLKLRDTKCYGVGSCGPRGFYGTADVHLQLEEELAAFFGAEEACVYSYGFSTAASAIPAYCKRKDVIFADEYVNFAIQKGFDAARSTIVYFKHNDMKELEKLLQKAVSCDKHKKSRPPRRFLVVEGIYQRTGELSPLVELVELRKKYQLRMFLDETISFGVLGATGRGAVEHWGISSDEVDLRIGSLEGALASVGGFCVGSSFIVEHQRLSGLGYCFSASLPPLLAVAALTSLSHLRNDTSRIQALARNSVELASNLEGLPGLSQGGHPFSPVKMLYITNSTSSNYSRDLAKLMEVADACFARGLAVLPPGCLPDLEATKPRACLRVVASALLDKGDIKTARETLVTALSTVDLFD